MLLVPNTDDINDYFHIYAENIDIDDFYFSIYNGGSYFILQILDLGGMANIMVIISLRVFIHKLIYRNAENNYKRIKW